MLRYGRAVRSPWPGSHIGLRITGLVLTGSLVGACGAAGPATPADGAGFPVTVAHRYGETTVPRAPERIVALNRGDRDVLLALDIVPYGMPDAGPDLPARIADRLAEVRRRTGSPTVPVEAYTQPSVVDVLPVAPPPDLLLATAGALGREDFDADRAVAPVVGPPPGYGDSPPPPARFGDGDAPWQDSTRLVGRAVGRPAQAERLVLDTEARFADTRARFPALSGVTAACVHFGSGRATESHAVPAGPRTACSRFLAGLGMRGLPALETGPGEPGRTVADRPDDVGELDLVVIDDTPEGRVAVIRDALPPGPVVVGLDERENAVLAAPTVLTLPGALDILPERLAGALR
ncbi:ABC transporter substrate-binding protein [Pseudonocardia sp. HH130630-07]|uniref:ABC transporter substrate-binding protein n=1 Tax=Pseudonocardia sp. HH130630-07 TaxID=1690815 RepID=UPI000814CE97|nr:ABC transporter substrate-binding protein [Pseudonocardia sp. HH130630-07]ANY08867.1 hypothetical protein AFB00_24325 [Pseudonocardia sp. HH130630-07]